MSDTPLDPVRPTAAIERGQWVIDELHGWGTLASIVPPRFESYVRIFHAASGQDLRWSGVGPDPAPGALWVAGREVHGGNEHPERWAEAAARWGTVFHPQAQWALLTSAYRQPKFGEDGWQYNDPPQGEMNIDELAAAAAVLARHTSTPDDCLATVWEGFVDVADHTRYVALTAVDDSASDPADDEGFPSIAPVSRQMLAAAANPLLRLNERASHLFELDIRALTDTSWRHASGWSARLGEDTLTPQSIWPDDRAWFLASEIDFDSTIVAGPPELIRDLLALAATGAIEALEIPADADLTITGDRINPMPEQPDYN